MNIGITYDLRDDYIGSSIDPEAVAELDSPETIDGIEAALRGCGHETERIGNIKALVPLLAAGRRWDLVFNIAEGMYGEARESQIPALLDAYRIPCTFSDPAVLALTLRKDLAKLVLRREGIPTPDWMLITDRISPDLENPSVPFPLFVKPVAEGTGKGIGEGSLVNDRESFRTRCLAILESYRQPALAESYLPGREFTVGIIGNGDAARALPALEVKLRDAEAASGYGWNVKHDYLEKVSYSLEEGETGRRCGDLALRAWRALGCRDCGRVDIRLDAFGVPHFLEVNPLAGLHPVDSDLPILWRLSGRSYRELIGEIVEAARSRIGESLHTSRYMH